MINKEYTLQPYDDALAKILSEGFLSKNRTGTDCKTVFGLSCRYDISERFPLLTKRKVWPDAIFKELLWYLQGSSNINSLTQAGSRIWEPWRDKSFEDKHQFMDGSLGPVYGFQFRYFNGCYAQGNSISEFYGAGGTDQLKYVCDLINTDPSSRRIVFSVWNPTQLSSMKLAPCHVMFQILINVEMGEMTGILTQRSADFPVGVPANIQFYSALIYMLCHVFDYRPKELIHNTGDSHIYVNQVGAVQEYLGRECIMSPTMQVMGEVNNELSCLDQLLNIGAGDFKITDYNPQRAIKMPVSV